ncbi:putative SAP domain containing protein [Lyophyllum shimeji]|uniref:SAP domain containing protein n=1 Tax=Lyophyllum shimeji TaxID=47721 RepID=A0A9P3UIU6_LYOSH|nr:putative SAP domain containing protein [Lyophyllum shimeji]
MFRTAVPRIPLVSLSISRRKFVSSVLLTRTWENESVAELRKELRNRGITPKGNKANLILQIQEYEKNTTLEAISSRDPPVPAGAREMATAAAPASEGVAQRLLPASEAVMNINMPDIWQPVPEPPVQIPFVPDFWDSSLPADSPAREEILPKLLVVAGAGTHLNGGPSHNLHDEHVAVETDTPKTPAPERREEGGILDDITDDLGIPRPKELKNILRRIFY